MLFQQQAGARKTPIVSWTVTFGLAPLKQVWKHAVRKQTHSHSLIPPQLARKPTSKTTFHNVHINNAYLTLWLCLSLLGLDFVLLSGYPTPFLGCVCAVSLPQTRERETARERVKVEGGSDICIPKVACDADSANGDAACALAALPLLPKSLPGFLFCHSTSTMATQRALIPRWDFMAPRLKCRNETFKHVVMCQMLTTLRKIKYGFTIVKLNETMLL